MVRLYKTAYTHGQHNPAASEDSIPYFETRGENTFARKGLVSVSVYAKEIEGLAQCVEDALKRRAEKMEATHVFDIQIAYQTVRSDYHTALATGEGYGPMKLKEKPVDIPSSGHPYR